MVVLKDHPHGGGRRHGTRIVTSQRRSTDQQESHPTLSGQPGAQSPAEVARERQLRRTRFLADLKEARELRRRVAPRRARTAEMHARLLRTFRY
jgi:hypothetical protein